MPYDLCIICFSDKILVVTELISGGSLKNFLRSKRVEFINGEGKKYENVHFGLNDRQLLIIVLQIASGMRHLEQRKVGYVALLCLLAFTWREHFLGFHLTYNC